MPRAILVVDDDPATRRLLTELLTRAGYAVRTAGDGLEALAEIARDPPALVLADIAMPRLGGAHLWARLRAAGNRVPVVLLSAFERPPGTMELPFVAKPCARRDLLAAVERELGRPGAWSAEAGELPEALPADGQASHP